MKGKKKKKKKKWFLVVCGAKKETTQIKGFDQFSQRALTLMNRLVYEGEIAHVSHLC
jgi:hypothetical protein